MQFFRAAAVEEPKDEKYPKKKKKKKKYDKVHVTTARSEITSQSADSAGDELIRGRC